MSDFAKQQLEKYGWSEGKGLGREENGIVKPIKAVLKFDNHGIGHDESKLWTSKWWCNIFNDASKRISVTKNETGIQLNCKKKAVDSNLPLDTAYKHFIKSGTRESSPLSFPDEIESISPVSDVSVNHHFLVKKKSQKHRNKEKLSLKTTKIKWKRKRKRVN